MANHRLDAAPETVHWGFFDAALKPQLTVASGDTVTISTVSGMASQMPAAPLSVPPALAAIHKSVAQKLPGHICTGPVAVKGARAGQVLEVRIKDIQLHYDWGYNMIRPLAGALPDDFETPTHLMTMAFDPDLDDCVVIALRDMIRLICRRTNLSREQAYTLCSLAADLRVTQVVNGNKGIHVMLEKKLLANA